jgi:hypothetical protein
MHFDEREEGGYRIYAGALEATQATGYVAAAVISRRDTTGQREAWRHQHVRRARLAIP